MSWRVIPLGRRGVDTVGLLIVLALSALAATVFLLPPLPTEDPAVSEHVIKDNVFLPPDPDKPGAIAFYREAELTPAVLAENAYSRLYERAEDASNAGVSLEDALQAVRDGYSSAAVDRDIAENGA